MTRAYVLEAGTHEVLGLLDQSYGALSYVRRYWAKDTFEIEINRKRLYATDLQKGRLVYLPDDGDLLFLIEQIAGKQEGSPANDQMLVSGRSIEGISLRERLCIPPAGQAYDKQVGVAAETAMKHYVDVNAGPSAVANRQIPGLVIGPDLARGGILSTQARYQAIADMLREIGLVSGLGWQITYDRAAGEYVFEVIEGVDRSASVFFDFSFETLEEWEELESLIDSKTHAIVAGQGEGADREIVERFLGVEKAGFERREAFIDARDVEVGATDILETRGDAFLSAAAADRRFEARVHQMGSFRYKEHWDLGDLVLVRHEERGIALQARVVEVSKKVQVSAAAPEITVVLDRPFPTLQERIEGVGSGGAVVDTPVSLPADPHAATHEPGGSDEIDFPAPDPHAASHEPGGSDEIDFPDPPSLSGLLRYVHLGSGFIDTFNNQTKAGGASGGQHTMSALPDGVVAAHGVLFMTPNVSDATYFAIAAFDNPNAYGGIIYGQAAGRQVGNAFVVSLDSAKRTWLAWNPAGGTLSTLYVRVIGYWIEEV